MTAAEKTCEGCAHTQTRHKFAAPKAYCLRYHQFRVDRCIDYRTKRSAVKAALDYLKRIGTK